MLHPMGIAFELAALLHRKFDRHLLHRHRRLGRQLLGSYELKVSAYSPPPIGTFPELADQLVNGYWGGDAHHFNVTPVMR